MISTILVPRGRDPSGQRQKDRGLWGREWSAPGIDSWRRPEGSRPLGTRMKAIFKPQIFSKSRMISSLAALEPNKSIGWFFEMIFSLQVRQTEVLTGYRLVGVLSAMMTEISLPVSFYCLSSINHDWTCTGSGQRSRSGSPTTSRNELLHWFVRQ